MSETFSRHRGGDLRAREPGATPSEKLDPLAELARLVGREDPFRGLFASREQAGKALPAKVEPHVEMPEAYDRYGAEEAPFESDPPESAYGPSANVDDASVETDEDAFHAPLGQVRRESFRLPALPASGDHFSAVEHGGTFGSHSEEAPELNPDLWAQGMPETVSAEPMHYGSPDAEVEAEPHGTQRRTLVVLLAVLALTVGGLGATFLVRSGGTSQGAAGELPTIMADATPTKVQPPDTSNQSTGGDGNTALIEKSASDNVANAKIVNTQEQPVDLSQLPQAPPAAAQAASPQPATLPDDGRVATATVPAGSNPSPFPEPHKVKTVLIRPDGSVVGEDQAAPAAPQPSAPAQATASSSVAKPSTPKSTARASSTPKTTASAVEGTAAVKPKAAAHVQPKPPAVQTAAADTPADTTASTTPATPASGSFAVQLAAPGTEQEAKDISARLQKKFSSQLDGHTPSIRKADKGDKSVYRVRVSNLSQDDAKALCSKLQAGGGSCFVVRN